jgi:monoamine oxidase
LSRISLCHESSCDDPTGEPVEYLDVNWAEEERSRGCFVGHFPSGAWTRFGFALREPVGRIHWAGTETAERRNGYTDGAIRSGERAAARMHDRLG